MRTFAFTLPTRPRVLTALLMVCCAFSQDSSFTRADFEKIKIITGNWINKRTNGDIYEHWERNSETELKGISYKLTGSDTVFLEKVRLYYQGKEIIYAPVAYGQNNEKQVLFKLKSIEQNRFVFENLLHDFPKRIVYDFRTADSLYAYIEGGDKRINYPYRRIN
jgi:hypothetical protein